MARRNQRRAKKKKSNGKKNSRKNEVAYVGENDQGVSEESATSKTSSHSSTQDAFNEEMVDFPQIASTLAKSDDSQLENAASAKEVDIEVEVTMMPEEEITSNLSQETNAATNPPDVKSTPLTATVYLAAPRLKNHHLAIIGINQFLGEWKKPQGTFKQIAQISDDISIFKGVVPVPSFTYSPFKFVHVNKQDNSYTYEGGGTYDNRTDELLPNSLNFFVFKLKPTTGIMGKIRDGLLYFFGKPETKNKIAIQFFDVIFTHVVENILPDWVGAYHFVSKNFTKIRKEIGNDISDSFREFLNQWLRKPDVNFDQLLLLVVGASEMKMYSDSLKNEIQKKSQEFSLHLYRLGIFNKWNFPPIFEQLANHAGPDYWWIFFHISRHVESLEKINHQEMSESIVKTMGSIPEVFLENTEITARVMDRLLQWNDIDQLYCKLQAAFAQKNADYQQQLDSFLINKLLTHTKNVNNLIKVLRSNFIKKTYEKGLKLPGLKSPHLDQSQEVEVTEADMFGPLIRNIFYSQKKLSDKMKLAINTPDYLLPAVRDIIEDLIARRKETDLNFDRDDYCFFAQLEDVSLDHFPRAKQYIKAKLLEMTNNYLSSSSFDRIPSIKLTLLGLSGMNLPLLESSSIVNLQESISILPRNFFQKLLVAINKLGDWDKILKTFRQGETKIVIERLENHFKQMDDIVAKVQSRRVQLIELKSLLDPQVLGFLKEFGLTADDKSKLLKEVELVKKRQYTFNFVYSRFARLNVPRIITPIEADNPEEEDGELQDREDPEEVHVCDRDEDPDANEEDLNVDQNNFQDTVQVLDSKEWEYFLKEINVEQSTLTLKNAIELPVPFQSEAAVWLLNIKDCALFMEKVWRPAVVESTQNLFPFCKEDLLVFVEGLADQWVQLAQRVADGSTSFQEMDEIIHLQSDANFLAKKHLKNKPVEDVLTAYRDFKNIQEMRHILRPFIIALRFFNIQERAPIDAVYDFVESNLLKNWEKMTLTEVFQTGMIQIITNELHIDQERPETRNAIQFIGSLVTEENASPLIEWLRKKTEKDMEGMGKILQGTLFEAYGQLQTLRTRIAPFLFTEFRTYQDLLKVVRISEERFAKHLSGRVQPINCKWLASMLTEIEAAVRASIISPSEDAKKKLAKLRRIVIIPKGDHNFTIEVHLNNSKRWISMDELKQAFQLLDMAVIESDDDAGELVNRTRKYVGLIENLANVFGRLFASGCITYTFTEQIVVELDELEPEIQRMKEDLDAWNSQWKEIERMPLLALFSRGYLIHLADLIGRNKVDDALSILKFVLPSAPLKLEELLNQLAKRAPRIDDRNSWLSTAQLFDVLGRLHNIIENIFYQQTPEIALPINLATYGRTLKSHFLDKAVVILNAQGELLVGSSLAAYIAVTGRPIEPSRILFVTANTDKLEVERFMTLWSVADQSDFFIIIHVERLNTTGATAVREGVDRVLPERRVKLLLLAQHNHRTQLTKSLGARLGLVSDRLLEINLTVDQLRHYFSTMLPSAENLHFFTSKLPGCGKSQLAMQKASAQVPSSNYYRISIRVGSVEELLASLKNVEKLSSQSRKQTTFLHLDIGHSVSLEFNDILLSLLIHGALYDPKNAKLGFWMISPETSIAIEFASPFGIDQFPVISYLGKHHICECNQTSFTYDLAATPNILGQPVTVNQSNALVVAGKFLQLKAAGDQGLQQWDGYCAQPDTILLDPVPGDQTFELLVAAFQHNENRTTPTFSALNSMASFLQRHVCAMINCMWFSSSAVYLFDNDGLVRLFKQNVFDMLVKVANDSIARCWSITKQDKKLDEMDWTNRQRAMFLLGLDEEGFVTGMNIVGQDATALRGMFHGNLVPILEQQCLRFQELRGFSDLMDPNKPQGAQVILNAMRSLLLLDGTATSVAKVYQLDSHPRNVPARQCLKGLTGQERGYVLTGDNITKMMFALYRIRCGLPVIVFGEAGVGKSALFRFMIETLLGHTFQVCNVNSGTTILDVEQMIESAIGLVTKNPNSQVFLFFDEMNTADPPVIAFFKELMLDRHCHGRVLPNNLYLMAAANPYRYLREVDKEAAVGLAFRFAQPANGAVNERNLVYRVNELPLAFYDHIYDFGQLSVEAEETYINEISQSGLSKPNFYFPMETIKYFSTVLRKSHKVAREMSSDPLSAVSLRDASRAVQLFTWFCFTPAGRKINGDNRETAFGLTIYLVYAFRFREREKFLRGVFGLDQAASKNMKLVSYTIARKLYEQAHGASIGSGAIALNDALCENLFALYVCILNGIFLIIVGRPGSSKSLSVEILKLVLSPGNHGLRSTLGDLPAVTEVYFQCSPLSTSSGFKALFDSARRMSVDPKTMFAMVVLDELGLADLSPEKPIKVLHSELERQSILTSGEEQQTPFSVVALSNWVVDAAQVNRGILITRTKADLKDLLTSAKQLADSLVAKHVKQSERDVINSMLKDSLERIVNTYQTLDEAPEVGGGHYFSMRDFFFCVKNFVCSVFDSIHNGQTANSNDVRVSQQFLIQSAIRNFGGHEKARKLVKEIIAKNMKVNEITIPEISPLDLIVQNIRDSSKPLSVHIARHLMILNRSMIGLQLLSRHVKNQLDKGTSWNVLFGSCFPGDLQLTAVTRKLRQVEQAIRTGGVLILCHADQLFESLYMVLNQQYWAQDDVTMTQIVLGPSIRPIALPSGPFRIIALQDTDVALNRELMSPAILSRFEKHELRPSHLLDDAGRHWLSLIESHPVWLAVLESVRRKKLMYGYHEETFASLALQLQDGSIPMEVDEEENTDSNVAAQVIWMRAANPMAMIKLERDSSSNPELLDVCRHYRHQFILEGIDDALNQIKSDRIVVMTNTLRHLEIMPSGSANSRYFIIQLFEVQTELELYRLLDTFQAKHLADPTFCLVVQYDAVTGPIEQFQLTKYEIGQRFEKLKCRVVFIVHVDPRPVNMHWVFSFGDGWDYCFVDEVVTGGPVDQHRIPLRELALSPANQTLSSFVRKMSIESFKSLLLEMLGPVLQTRLASLRSSLGQFYSGVRTALGMPNNHTLLQLLNECFLVQLDQSRIVWNVVDAVNDPDFDSSSSLTEGLWGVFKNKLSNPLAHLLLVSDVWRVCDESSAKLWCDFVTANYPDRLMTLNSSDVVQIPVGFRSCTRPFGRLLVLFDVNFTQRPGSSLNGPLHWLLDHLAKNQDGNYQEIREAYFMDWFLLRIPPHLHICTRKIPISKIGSLVDRLFEDPSTFFLEWDQCKAEVISALELISIASFAKTELGEMRDDLWSGVRGPMRNWKSFVELTSCITLTTLASPEVLKTRDKFMQSISSIEVSPILSKNLQDRVKEMPHLWLGLRISKRILLFNPESDVKLEPELQVSTPRILLESLIQLVINSVIRPRVTAVNGTKRLGHQADLHALLKSTSSCNSTEELVRILGECPVTRSIVLINNATGVRCSSCHHPLETGTTVRRNKHWREPKAEVIESLFHHHQKFMFFFERVTELFIQERKDNPHHIQEFVEFLLSDDSRLRVSWRFLTVIVRSILSTQSGTAVIDAILSTIRCNRLTSENTNVHNFMRALLASADQDARRNVAGLQARTKTIDQDLIVAAMTGKWTVKRIGRLALIRHQLSSHNPDATTAVISQWANWSATVPNNPAVTDSLLFFILRFSSAEGDQTRLSILFRHQQIAKILDPHQVVGNYIRNLSPLSLGFDLQSAESKAIPFQEHLINGIPVENSLLQHYQILLAQQPNWAPFIARLAYHAADVFQTSNIRLLSSMSSNLINAAEYYLPGIDNHPYWASFNKESYRWYMCYCGTLNCVGNCGNPTLQSICLSCKMALGDTRGHYPRAGVRRATHQDFLPPTGIHVSREPSVAPNWSVRNLTPVVTRFSLLLNSLALMNSALNPRTERHAINHLLLTLISTERKPDEDRRSLIQLLSRHIVVHLDILYQLMVVSRPQLAMTDKFRFGHLLLHKLLTNQDSLTAHAVEFSRGTEAREVFEQGLARLLAREVNIGTELDTIISHDQATKNFRRSLLNNETSHWSYARLVFSDRQSVQLELARSDRLRQSLPFLNLLLDDIWMQKLDALQYLGDAIRFVALVRTVLQGEVTQEDANTMTIRQGLEKISMIVKQKSVILDRGRPVASGDDVAVLFDGFKQLWDRFSQLENTEKKTFLDYFECQEVNINVRPKTVLDETAPLILIMAGSEQPEMAFCCQLLNHAVQAASSLALTSFIQPHCRAGSGRVRLHCSSAAALSDFDESLYAHVTTEEVDGFIRDHAIDMTTLQLAESFAMAAILGPAGSTIAEDIYLDVVPEFVFKDDVESNNYLVLLERRSIHWKPSPIPPPLQELILSDLEKNRSLAEARSVLVSAITHLQTTTEPLVINKVRDNYISDVLEELIESKILTERHISIATIGVFNRYLRLQVCHAFGLLKAILFRMNGDDIFGGRIPKGWGTMLPERLAQLTTQKLRFYSQTGGITETLLELVKNVAIPHSVSSELTPDKSLLYAIRQLEGDEWDGIPDDVKMEHLGHVLLISESISP